MAGEERIRVAVRAKPHRPPPAAALHSNGNGSNARDMITGTADGTGVLVFTDDAHAHAASFRCDTFIPPSMPQADVFDAIHGHELVESALDGFPVTIFAYGQTGAGKSFTIFGKEDGATEKKLVAQPLTDGVLPRAAAELMRVVDKRRDAIEYTLRLTCVEIYNDVVKDVFDPRKTSLAVRATTASSKDAGSSTGFFLENATVVQCATAAEMIRVIKTAAMNRTKSSHLLNERSNRSHCILTIYIDAMPLARNGGDDSNGGVRKYGKLTVVDLAGSERVNDTGAVGAQLKETGHINKSLYTLNQVIQALSSKAKTKFVPVRDSKLTMLLIDSLGGNSKTLMIACVNAAPQFSTESIRTLEFAMGVAKIKNRPTAVLSPHEKLIMDLKEQIRLLQLENTMLRARTPGYFTDHPEHADLDDAGYRHRHQQQHQQQLSHGRTARGDNDAFSPLAKALMTNRRTDENQVSHDLRSSIGSSNNTTSGFVSRFNAAMAPTQQRQSKSSGDAQSRSLRTLKKKVQTTKHTSKSTQSPVRKQQQQPVRKRPAALSESVELPPVRPFLASPSASASSIGHGHGQYSVTAGRTRPASPPPDYDDLFFGIETVPIPSAAAAMRDEHSRSKQLLVPLTGPQQQQQQYRPQEPHQTHSRERVEPSTEASLQQLLQQMMSPHQHQQPSSSASHHPTIKTPAPVKNSLSPASRRSTTQAPTEWDDDRAQQLFQQLCNLK